MDVSSSSSFLALAVEKILKTPFLSNSFMEAKNPSWWTGNVQTEIPWSK